MSEGNSSAERNAGQALVLSGGGARAAYQVGCLRAVSKRYPTIGRKFSPGFRRGQSMPPIWRLFRAHGRKASKLWWAFGNRCEPKRCTAPDSAP